MFSPVRYRPSRARAYKAIRAELATNANLTPEEVHSFLARADRPSQQKSLFRYFRQNVAFSLLLLADPTLAVYGVK